MEVLADKFYIFFLIFVKMGLDFSCKLSGDNLDEISLLSPVFM